MGFESIKHDAPFARMEKPGFKEEVREKFAEWMEERATESDMSESGTQFLTEMVEKVRRGEKIPYKSLAPELFRSLFRNPDAPMYKRLTQVEIDALEKHFFE